MMPSSSASVSAAGGSAGSQALSTHHRQSSRSNSVSGSSVSTIKRTASLSSSGAGARNSVLPMRPQSPNDTSLIALRLGGGQISQVGKRRKSVAVDPSEQVASEGLGNLNRWSQSTDSSATSPAKSRRKRASSGAALPGLVTQTYSLTRPATRQLIDHSPRASPNRKYLHSPPPLQSQYSPAASPDRGRRVSSNPQAPSIPHTNLPPLHTSTSRGDPNEVDTPSTGYAETPSTTGLVTPSTHSSYAPDYFSNENVSPRTTIKNKRPVMSRIATAPAPTPALNYSRMPRSEDVQESVHKRRQSEMLGPSESGPRPVTAIMTGDMSKPERAPRTRERSEKDKKAMLSKALQKANTAVLLDNAQNFEGALEAYSDACRLLQHVMDRSPSQDDKRKLEAIRVTYTNRIEELKQLEDARPPTRDEKGLPSRPMSDDSLKSPIEAVSSPIAESVRDSAIIETATATRIMDVPKLSYQARDRDSFFSKTLADVQRAGRSRESLAPRQENAESIEEEEEPMKEDEPAVNSQAVHLPPPEDEHSPYMPAPLLPKKQSSPMVSPVEEPPVNPSQKTAEATPSDTGEPQSQSMEQTEEPRDRGESNASISWLDTIDESASSCGSSVHSRSSRRSLHRKHIRNESGATDPDFDAAFDAAVEAAYDEGLEPDMDSRSRRLPPQPHARNESIVVPSGDIKEMLSPTAPFHVGRNMAEALEDEEEERLLDEMTQDYGHGFNFDLSTKSALPRQSDSSGYSRSTWQSSQVSDRTTAATSLSTVQEDLLSARLAGKHASVVSSVNTVRAEQPPPPPLAPPPTGALPRPPSLAEKRASIKNRRLSGQNPKQLKIETAKPGARQRASTFHHSPSAAPFANEAERDQLFDQEVKLGVPLEPSGSNIQHEHFLQSPRSQELRSAVSQASLPTTTVSAEHRTSFDESPGELRSARPALFRKNKSSISLREVLVPSREDSDHHASGTPMSSTFGFSRNRQDPLTSQRSTFPLHHAATLDPHNVGGVHLFDTTLTAEGRPGSADESHPTALEPCPESNLLRPFWLMRSIGASITHPRGAFLTTKLFVPKEVWQTRGVKLKAVDDKIANCDLLTAALGRLASVDTYDADAVMEELQGFEEVMERVQATLVKKLGSEVGVHSAATMFKDAPGVSANGTSTTAGADGSSTTTDKAAKSNSGKSYLSSWRKLRSKSSGTPLSTTTSGAKAVPGTITERAEPPTMASVPMTSFVPVERRGQKAVRDVKGMVFEGPQKEYMGSLARLVQGVGVLGKFNPPLSILSVAPDMLACAACTCGVDIAYEYEPRLRCARTVGRRSEPNARVRTLNHVTSARESARRGKVHP